MARPLSVPSPASWMPTGRTPPTTLHDWEPPPEAVRRVAYAAPVSAPGTAFCWIASEGAGGAGGGTGGGGAPPGPVTRMTQSSSVLSFWHSGH